ncbi:dnl zinc finger domain-containing protein [Ophiostoma piceae UAMH 11346]|uniref:Dnl zinc finger domain-containing protein n=1 Tax=Ophiostoma piceae (strain UAMH 11346) TaxID=1262450 RepID=S3C0W3_OPHP1|nr:dnl zinc finger domain-containing protein [Ophiostoma piceae UAMH 11346]
MASKQAWALLTKQPIAARTATASRALRCSPVSVQPGCSPFTRSASFFPTASPISSLARQAYRGAVQPRLFSSSSVARSADETGVSSGAPQAQGEKQQDTSPPPQYELTFTCKPCGTRSAHKISKQGYHHGSVLITCPSCRNRHIISDHLGIFGTAPGQARTIEDIMREKGQFVKKGTLGEDGDVEFWEDGSSSDRKARQDDEGVVMAKKKEGAEAEAEKNAAPGSTFQPAGKP